MGMKKGIREDPEHLTCVCCVYMSVWIFPYSLIITTKYFVCFQNALGLLIFKVCIPSSPVSNAYDSLGWTERILAFLVFNGMDVYSRISASTNFAFWAWEETIGGQKIPCLEITLASFSPFLEPNR